MTKKGGLAPLESPDGKFLYYAKALFGSSVWKVPVETGEEAEVLESLSFYANMAVVHDGIYFIPKPTAATGFYLQFFSIATGKIKTIAALEKTVGCGLAVSPDGRWILYTQEDQIGSDLMLVENFR